MALRRSGVPALLLVLALLVAVAAACAPARMPAPVPPAEPPVSEGAPTAVPGTQRPATPGPTPSSPAGAGATATIDAEPAAPDASPSLAPLGATERARVVRVVDGDTIVVDRGRGEERLRYIGVDTPESVDPRQPVEWLGREAAEANRLLVEGREVTLERDVSERDQFDRLLRYVWLRDDGDWLLVNLELVRRGFAQVVTYPPDVRHVDRLLDAQDEAREGAVGLWGDPPGDAVATPMRLTAGECDPAYPGVCIPPPPPDLDCRDVAPRRFEVLPPDPHRFDGNGDGVGCERD